MSFNGAGGFSIDSTGYPVVYDTVIAETVFNQIMAEIASGLSATICRDGQSVISQNIPLNAKRITNLGAGTGLLDAVNQYNVLTNTAGFCTGVSGTVNAIVLDTVASTELLSYAQGMQLWFMPFGANTGAVTVDVAGLGTKTLAKVGSVALAAGDLQAGEIACIVYDGTRFQLVSPYYAEGNWTPSVGGSATYTTQIGRWTKVGRAVHVLGYLVINTIGTGSTNVISGLPATFPAANIGMDHALSVSDFNALATSVVWIGARVNVNATTIALRNLTAAGASATSSALLGNGSAVAFGGTYFI